MWEENMIGNPVAIIPNSIPSQQKDSICLYLTIQDVDDPLDWVTVSEISNAWLGGEEIEDCDSPLNDNPDCLLYTSPSPRDLSTSRMPSSA